MLAVPPSANFAFLRADFPALYALGTEAELLLYTDPAAALMKLRLFGERLTERLFAEHQLPPPTENTQHRRLEELRRGQLLPGQVGDILDLLRRKGNQAAHQNRGSETDAELLLESAFHLGSWLVGVYGDAAATPAPGAFALPALRDTQQELAALASEKQALEARVAALQAQLAARPALSAQQLGQLQARASEAAKHLHLSEAETRAIIDEQLRAAGWEVDTPSLRYANGTRPVKGRNLAIAEWPTASGPADYALFVGTVLVGVVEAKREKKDVPGDIEQAKRYSRDIKLPPEAGKLAGAPWGQYQAPFLFSTNGRPYHYQLPTKSGIWFLDGRRPTNHAQALRGWYSPAGLLALHAQDIAAAEAKLKAERFDYLRDPQGLSLRPYQIDAIEAVETAIRTDAPERRALLAMATGTGKTRTILGLIYRLLKSGRFRRVLFLVDRTVLGTQATDSFNDVQVEALQTLGQIYDIKDLREKLPEADTRLHIATVQALVKRIYYPAEGVAPLPVDTYDCIIVDEAHRGYTLDKEMTDEQVVFKNQLDYLSLYKTVLDYFDAFRVGLTATPALHTVEIFGKPVFRYTYRQAVIDGYLIDHEPALQIQTQLNQHGIVWEAGATPQVYNPATQAIEDLDTLADELKIEVDGFNKLVLTEPFNRAVAGALVQHLDPEGPQKALIFAATDEHADLVVQLLKEAFEDAGIPADDDAIVKITGAADKPQQRLKRYQNEQYPTIVVTVDLLTTGVDVPHICHLVFLRRVKSRILYEQMLGRATRRADDIGKETFRIYDAVRLYEALDAVTTMQPVVADATQSVEELIAELAAVESEAALAAQIEQIVARLHRKRNQLPVPLAEDIFRATGGQTLEQFLAYVRTLSPARAAAQLMGQQTLLALAARAKGPGRRTLVSTHADEVLDVVRGYGEYQKPEDYLEAFASFIRNNENRIAALTLVRTAPQELTRDALRELKHALDRHGFNTTRLSTAWQQVKKQDLGADLIAYIRTLTLGVAARPLADRVKSAVDHVRGLREWNVHQRKFLDRVQAQLLKETIVTPADLDTEPFKADGGLRQFDKLMGGQVVQVLRTIQEQLYPAA